MNETLARLATILRGEATPGFVRAIPDGGWLALIGFANRERHLLVPALHVALARPELDAALPGDVRGYLALLGAANMRRNAAIRRDIAGLVAVLNGAGLCPLLLKGAAMLTDGRRALPGRMVGDIDILVPAAAEAAALAALRGAGFVQLAAPKDRHTIADFGRPGDRACVDLHRRLLDPPFEGLLPGAAVLARAETVTTAGLRFALPALEDHARHAVLHAQINDRCYYHRQLCLGTARDVAALAGALDWEEMARWATAMPLAPVLEATLLAAEAFFGLAWPFVRPASLAARRHHARACALAGGSAGGLGRLAQLRETFAPDRLAARFGGERGYVGGVALLLRQTVRMHGLAGACRRLVRA